MSRKTIKINEKEYEVSSTAYTRFIYKKTFGVGIMADLKKLTEITQKQDDFRKELQKKKMSDEEIEQQVGIAFMDDIDDLIDVIMKITYILILTADSKMCSYEDWLKSIEKIDLSEPWVSEVTEIAVDSFRG